MQSLINVPVANLYSQPDGYSEVISQALYGWEITPISTSDNYFKIQTADGYQGWVDKLSLIKTHRDPILKSAKIIHNAVHIYYVPDTTTQKPKITLPFEVSLEIIAEPEDEKCRWIQVRLIDGTLGWVQRGDITINQSPIDGLSMLSLSRQFIGLPYTWGGVSSFGYDCSGYVQMLYRQVGVLLPRDAKDQIKSPFCAEIRLQEAIGGDLIFFGPTKEKITHVALCLDSYHVIHAKVKPIPILQINRLDDPALGECFAYRSASRVIGLT
jgi:gamma-D-glutamyl-L-lysine dipeptidyl-peptidase